MIEPFREHVLVPEQRTLLQSLGPLADRCGYYLAGGTAVALRLGHRPSIDFDWFSDSPISLPAFIPMEWSRIKRFFIDSARRLRPRG